MSNHLPDQRPGRARRSRGWRIGTGAAWVLALTLWGVGSAQGWEMVVCADVANLPFSNQREEGFENRIASILAEELGAELRYEWLPIPSARQRDLKLQGGECDLVMAAVDGQSGVMNTLAYYRSTYVFVYRADGDLAITSFDDERLRDLKIGVQLPDGRNVGPPTQALATRGLIANQVGYLIDYQEPDSLGRIIDAVAEGEVDVAVAWGPVAGYFAARHDVDLVLEPVQPEIDVSFVSMVYPITIGVREGDEDLRDLLDVALARRWDDVTAILDAYDVVRLPLPPPSVSLEAP